MYLSARRLAPLAVATVLATGGYAFLTTSTTPHTNAGFAQTDVEGYKASNVHYTLGGPGATDDTDNKSFIRTGAFDYRAENRGFQPTNAYPLPEVYASISSTGPDHGYVPCTSTDWDTTTGAGHFTCSFVGQNNRLDTNLSPILKISGAQ